MEQAIALFRIYFHGKILVLKWMIAAACVRGWRFGVVPIVRLVVFRSGFGRRKKLSSSRKSLRDRPGLSSSRQVGEGVNRPWTLRILRIIFG
jgi:hypothetical protein